MTASVVRRTLLRWVGLTAVSVAAVALAQPVSAFIEPPALEAEVSAGTLPPVAERLPQTPQVVDLAAQGKEVGQHGGTLRTLMGRARDTRMMVVYGYARLASYTPDWELVPDILERIEVEEGRIFTFHLRKGHRWSDGHPFTAEDFRYVWEDVLNNPETSPGGLPQFLIVDGEPGRFEMLDETTVRYSWSQPNTALLPTLAGARPEYLHLPSHYLKQFHADYADEAELAERVEKAGQRNWAALHYRHAQQYNNENPNLPSLQPWVLVTDPPSTRFIFRRNPYYHRVDPDGRQLPYVDEVILNITNAQLIPAKAAAGETDLQARGLGFENFAVLKQGERRHDFQVRLWASAAGAEKALYPNLNVSDATWREVVRNPDFRRALSLAIDRAEINHTIYFGLAEEGANTVLPQSPLFRPDLATAWATLDIPEANRLLDGMGLTERDRQGVRRLPNGRPLELIVETAGEDVTEVDILQLIRDSWNEIGVKLHITPLQREVFRNRVFAGSSVMTIWKGLENGIPTPEMSPRELVPTHQVQLHWPQWGLYRESRGQGGEPIDLEPVIELVDLYERWKQTTDVAEKTEIWERMLDIHAEQVFTIGIVRGVPQPVVISNRLRNVPAEAVYNWEPGAHFGVHQPDTFWFVDAATARAD
ncbi:MAG: ABC transporter substrate-binding protein [Rhodospirillales bacterium]|nr:MAG: ABC transporter substrate-binding protein [Rhodospirillales bacterium]